MVNLSVKLQVDSPPPLVYAKTVLYQDPSVLVIGDAAVVWASSNHCISRIPFVEACHVLVRLEIY